MVDSQRNQTPIETVSALVDENELQTNGYIVLDTIDNIDVIRIDDDFVYGNTNPYTPAGFTKLSNFLDSIQSSYYGAPDEDFFLKEAIESAQIDRNTKVYVENLS